MAQENPTEGRNHVRYRSYLIASAAVVLATSACVRHSLPQGHTPSRPIITIWNIASPGSGRPPGDVPIDFKRLADRFGFQLHVHAVAAARFRPAFLDARRTHDEPDILVLSNRFLLDGFPKGSPFQEPNGIVSEPGVSESLVNVSESFRSLSMTIGYRVLVRTSRHYPEARALALRPIDCASKRGSTGATWNDPSGGVLTKAAERSVVAHLTNDRHALDELSGGHYPDDALPIEHRVLGVDPPARAVKEVQVCGAWGNEQLAFVNVVATFESPDEIGYRVLLAVMSVDGTRPRLLALSESPGIVPRLWESVRLESAGTPSPITAPELVAPQDEVSVRRFNRMSKLIWRPSTGAERFVYLLEWQFASESAKRPQHWQNDHLMLGPIEPTTSRITTSAPFGVNYPATRWRVWAMDRQGDVALSNWRIIYVH